MAITKTTAKTNPITGMSSDKNPRREARQEKREVRREAKELNRNLNEGIKKEGGVKQYYKGVPGEGKTRLERKMDKYGVEPASSKLSPSQQKEFNKNRVKLAKEKERAATPTPGRDKVKDKVNKVLGRGKYDRGSKKNMDMGGNKSKVCVDKAGQKAQDAGCKISMEGKFKQAFKKKKPVKNTMWTISK